MSGTNVLLDIRKSANKPNKTPAIKEKDAAAGSANAASAFAVMLNGSLNLTADPKGQICSIAGPKAKEKQSSGNPVLSMENSSGQGTVPGYGDFLLSFLTQGLLQSEIPAGKEANSGNVVSQRAGSIATADLSLTSAPVVPGKNLELALLNLISLTSDGASAQSGMFSQKPQADSPGITELDKYRQVIGDLLEKLSGEITENSLQEASLGAQNTGTRNLSLEMAKIMQSWLITDTVDTTGKVITTDEVPTVEKVIATDEVPTMDKAITTNESPNADKVTIEGGHSNGLIQSLLDLLTARIGSNDPALNVKISTLLATLYQKYSQEEQGTELAEALQGVDAAVKSKDEINSPMAKINSNTFWQQLKGTDSNAAATEINEAAAQLTNAKQIPEEISIQKGDSTQIAGLSERKDRANQNPYGGIGLANNLTMTNTADGKTTAAPVWEQISTVIHEQLMNKSQELKQLDIQLHPADLGKILIDLHWENGQVHLQVQASQEATGQLLQNQLPDLRHALVNQGINCGMLQMGQGGERQQNSQGNESRRKFSQNTHLDEDDDLIPVNVPFSLKQDGTSRINVTA